MEVVKIAIKIDKYPAYKYSGVEWLGEIPEGWDVRRFKTLFNEINERNSNGSENLLSVSQYTGVTKKSDRTEEGEMLSRASSLDDYKKVYKNDLVSNIMLAWNGSLGFSPYNGITSPAYSVYRLKKENDTRFFHYLVRSEIYKSVFKRNSTGVIESRLRLYTDDFYNIFSVLPPPQEQTAIANFLDNKTSKIDTAIVQKEQMIALLKERKQIIIQNAVTKGLDPNAKMKDSGVEWIGEIPEGWEVKKLRYLGQTQNGISAGAEYFGSGFPFVSYGDVYNNIELPKTVKGLAQSTKEDQIQYSVKKGDVFFTRTSETIEEVGFTSVCVHTIDNSTFGGFLIRFRPSSNNYLYEGFSKFYFSSVIHRAYFVKEMNLVTRASLSQELLKNLPVLLPSIAEQKEISNYIETQSTKIDQAITLQQSQIEKLKEYKATLIDSAVTGKIKVTDE